MIAWEIEAKRALANSVPDDFGTGHFPENQADIGTTCILERRVSIGIVHACVDIKTEVRIPQRNSEPKMLPWTP